MGGWTVYEMWIESDGGNQGGEKMKGKTRGRKEMREVAQEK